ncbi:MAG: TIGR03936 family radical SAM-associated protein [Phycisphaerae bacterium]|nr:TIGR03936 family radical SAM-associated protein [Phycisphaerae bacterium]MDP7287283.1 TIGR03936 family radical SAM-associated protein [Phycisphaerae bacterium]
MPQRWAMWMAVHGDLRFASHHDMMRVIERALLRAKLPLKYSQGFSPRAIMSLAFPRPVGVSADRDLLVLSLESSMLRQELLEAANRCCPQGLGFTDAIRLEIKATPHPSQCTYQIRLPDDKSDAVARSVEEFSSADSYPVQRTKHPKRRNRRGDSEPVTRTLDLKLLIDKVRLDSGTLSWRQTPHQTLWAKPVEAMKALGLDPVCDLAMVTRTSLDFQDLNEYSGQPDDLTDGRPETT